MRLIGTAHMLVANNVTSANRPAGTNGGLVYNTTQAEFNLYESGTWRQRRDLTLMNVSGQGTGDIYYAAGPTSIARLAAGGSGSVLQANGAAAPTWVANAGALAVLTTGSGVTTSSGTLASVTIAGLATTDRLMVVVNLFVPSGGTVGTRISLMGSAVEIGRVSNAAMDGGATGAIAMSRSVVSKHGSLANGIMSWSERVFFVSTGTSTGAPTVYAASTGDFGTTWVGTWTLALEATAPSATGTMFWAWVVYQMKSS